MEIELKNINKKFKYYNVLNDINVKFKSGIVYGIIGRNGSGKTVLLKLITGYLNSTNGFIMYNGKILGKDLKIPPKTRCLIENPRFISNMTGYQNLKLLADIKGIIGKKEIEETLKKVNLFEEKDKLYYKYSLGMKQKLGIAQVLMEDPDIIILDEPFNGIEEESATKIRNVLLEEKKKDKIIILATHIKEDIETLCDEIYLMDNGSLKKL